MTKNWPMKCQYRPFPTRCYLANRLQARNQDFMRGGANEAKADPTTEMYLLSSDPFI